GENRERASMYRDCLLPAKTLGAAVVFCAALQAGIDSAKTYRVGVDHAPPYNLLLEGGKITGLAVEVVREAAKRAGVRIEFVPINLPVDEALRSGKVDMWPAATDTQERRQWLYVAEPWLANRLTIVSRKEAAVRNVDELRGKRVAVLRDRI